MPSPLNYILKMQKCAANLFVFLHKSYLKIGSLAKTNKPKSFNINK